MKITLKKLILIVFYQLLVFTNLSFADSNTFVPCHRLLKKCYRFPEARVDSVVGGRNFHQPLASTAHLDRVIPGVTMSVKYRQIVDYNRTFVSREGDNAYKRINVRPDEIVIGISYGNNNVLGQKIELGANFSQYRDQADNILGLAVDEFHRSQKAFRYIPKGIKSGIPFGNGGLKMDDTIGQKFELYAKAQLTEEKEGSILPTSAIIITVSVPVTNKEYDHLGGGVVLAMSKEIVRWATLQASASLACQNGKPSDFNATDIFVRKCVYNAYAGLVLDPYPYESSKGNFYLTAGLGWHQMPMGYLKGPQDRRDVGVLYVNLNYDIKNIGISAGVKEDIINVAEGSVQDFSAIATLNFYDVNGMIQDGIDFFTK